MPAGIRRQRVNERSVNVRVVVESFAHFLGLTLDTGGLSRMACWTVAVGRYL